MDPDKFMLQYDCRVDDTKRKKFFHWTWWFTLIQYFWRRQVSETFEIFSTAIDKRVEKSIQTTPFFFCSYQEQKNLLDWTNERTEFHFLNIFFFIIKNRDHYGEKKFFIDNMEHKQKNRMCLFLNFRTKMFVDTHTHTHIYLSINL